MTSARVVAAFAAAVLCAVLAHAQGAPDFSKVEIKANRVTDKFYTLDGQGGTIGVLFGPDGVFMVDTQFAPLSEKRSEEHTSELQSLRHLVCRLLLEKKK